KKFLPTKKLPFYLYTGGLIGVATTMFNNLAFGKIGVSAILALILLGQMIVSLIIDHFGWFNMPKRAFPPKKLFGIAFVIAGIACMLSFFETSMLMPILVSFFSGVTIVIARTINARFAEETNTYVSTFYNYVTGLSLSCLILAFLSVGGYAQWSAPAFSLSDVWAYTGGLIGVVVVLISNIIVTRISSFYMTLLVFIGQIFTGILLDSILSNSFSRNILIGGLFVTVGFIINIWMDKRNATTIKE
ncbi:MAG: DMT family transporter, partial [Eubacteriales bacterium]